MDLTSENLGALVLKRVATKNIGEFSLDGQMLSVLMEVDGKQNVRTIAKKLGMEIRVIRSVIAKLLKYSLIEAREDAIVVIDKEFLAYLKNKLSLAIGPIAEILIEDAASDLGYTPERFPSHRAAELVDLLARQIRREDKMAAFKKDMVGMIRKKGY